MLYKFYLYSCYQIWFLFSLWAMSSPSLVGLFLAIILLRRLWPVGLIWITRLILDLTTHKRDFYEIKFNFIDTSIETGPLPQHIFVKTDSQAFSPTVLHEGWTVAIQTSDVICHVKDYSSISDVVCQLAFHCHCMHSHSLSSKMHPLVPNHILCLLMKYFLFHSMVRIIKKYWYDLCASEAASLSL